MDVPPDPDRPVILPIEDSIDLHAFAPADVREVLLSYLEEAHARGFHEVRVIHGRGIGAQRELVRATLDGHPLVLGFADAPPERGGWGATLARLAAPVDPAPRRADNVVPESKR